MRALVVLGATGSIGSQTLEVADRLGLQVAGLAARHPSDALARLAAAYPEARVVIAEGEATGGKRFAERIGRPVEVGPDAVRSLAAQSDRTVVNGVVGSAGLAATLAALDSGNRVALANKESLVVGGPLVKAALGRGGGELIPVDSEHSALHQCLAGEHPDDVARIILTASGGPFRGRDRGQLEDVTPEEALAHPTWDMGARITVDSATLMNKGLEVIEAHHLFDAPFDKIEVVVHPRSIVHSAVEFIDGALKAHIGHPDMRIPIQYALTYPRRAANPGEPFSLENQVLEFEPVDRRAFPGLDLAYSAGAAGGTMPAVLNAADEVAVEAFLGGHISFLRITEIVEETLESVERAEVNSFDDVVAADAEAREVARAVMSSANSRL